MLNRSTGGRAIDRARDKGWVKATLNGGDHRVTDFNMTPAAKIVPRRLQKVASRQLHRALEGLTASELRQLDRILERIVTNFYRLQIE